ncbi:MAG: GAF domain-containing protein [Bacteroidales bacterium]|nr:GAF domain-containing protein [Bacteroidales bacterium]
MKKKNKDIIIAVLILLFCYIAISVFFIYNKYNRIVKETILSTSLTSRSKAIEVSDYINNSVKTASAISDMLSSANQMYGHNMFPYVEEAMKKLAIENPDYSSLVVTWDYSIKDPNWFKQYGRYIMETSLKDGIANVTYDIKDIETEASSDEYYQMKNGTIKTLFTNIKSLKSQSDYYFVVSIPIEVDESFVGTVSISIPLSKLEDIISRQPTQLKGDIFIITNNGKIAIHPNQSFINTFFKDAYSNVDSDGSFSHGLQNGTLKDIDYEYTNKSIDFFDFSTSNKSHICFYPIFVNNNTNPWALGYEIDKTIFVQKALSGVLTFILLTILGLFILIAFSYFFIMWAQRPMKKVSEVLQKLKVGDFDAIQKLESNDEDTQKMFSTVNFLADRIMRTTTFARSIGKGELETQFDSYDDNDALDIALIEMQKNLLHARAEEKKRIEENEKLSWSQNGLAQIGEYLRMNNADIQDFSYNIISFLVKYIDASQGTMFVTEEKDGVKYLDQKATYALDVKKQLNNRVEFGESLVGRCALERKSIFITDVPDGYLYITSGLGEHKPNCILLVPLQFEDEVHGVIEVASLNIISEHQISFFNSVAERIASTISNIKKNINNAELLNKFSTQSNELARREKEIENSYHDIKVAQNEVKLSERETVAILDVLSQTSIITRYDLTGKVLDLRDKTLESTGYKQADIVGHNIKEVLALTKSEVVSFDLFWNDVINGQNKVRFFTRGETKFRETFSLLYDIENMPFKVISVAVAVDASLVDNDQEQEHKTEVPNPETNNEGGESNEDELLEREGMHRF